MKRRDSRFLVLTLILGILLAACTRFRAADVNQGTSSSTLASDAPPPPTWTPGSPTQTTPTPVPSTGGANTPVPTSSSCPDYETAFARSYWPFVQTKCTLCHGSGVTDRAFASSNFSEAFASYRIGTTNTFKNAKIMANATNPLHGTPATNGSFNQTAVMAAEASWQAAITAACAPPTSTVPTPPMDGSSSGGVTATTLLALGIVNQQNVMTTYRAATGVPPSADTIMRVYKRSSVTKGNRAGKRFMLPVNSQVSGYNSADLMITLVMTAEHCRDLVEAEAKLPAANRVFYGSIDLSAANASGFTTAQVDSLSAAVAKKFWRRSLGTDEAQLFRDALTELKSTSGSAQEVAIELCTLGLASLSANIR